MVRSQKDLATPIHRIVRYSENIIMADPARLRLLVKAKRPLGAAAAAPAWKLGVAATSAIAICEPLFDSIGRQQAFGAAPTEQWLLATTTQEFAAADPWSVCHDLVKQNPDVLFAEPDTEQKWEVGHEERPQGMGIGTGPAHHQKIENGYEGDPDDDYWFRDDRHGQFDRAAKSVPATQEGPRVRIAHLDTGFDPNHATCPAHIRGDLQRNFEADHPDDATDRPSGPINNFSHGCGTLSILAGGAGSDGVRAFGCAPDAEIVPIRVASGVVLFSNSSVARGLDYVHKLCANEATRIHIVSMSMGGLPSQAWAEAINHLYEAGVIVVCAAGNNYANAPTRFIVYPARFNRVIAACGVMAGGQPYADLPPMAMAGNYGPDSKTRTAIAAYTPNVPWARFGEEKVVDFDGNGTSAATPQVAGTAALWIQKFRQAYDAYPEGWMRVEAVRAALFESAAAPGKNLAEKIGQGRLQAAEALGHAPKPAAALKPENTDNTNWALLRLLLGDSAPLAAAQHAHPDMLEIEAMQALISNGLEFELDETARTRRAETIDKLLRLRTISEPLRKALSAARPAPAISEFDGAPAPQAGPTKSRADEELEAVLLQSALHPPYPAPPHRKLRIYAYDPGQGTKPDLYDVAEATVPVPWEALKPGPVGEYLEIIDIDPASERCYAPVNLEAPQLLAQNGLAPSEPNPQFHQQMVYAVAMRTIDRFEKALGRKALWAPRMPRDANGNLVGEPQYIPTVRVYPHALREANAYYNPEKFALLFGYFKADVDDDAVTKNSTIFGALSHDIVAHETTHALLDGLHPRFSERTNIDLPAFHEAFADIVALFQHFSMPESLMRQIRMARGALEAADALGGLARQFGQATGLHGDLRRFVGRRPTKLTPEITEPHARGAILVSAVFAAFLTIYRARARDLIRLATNGTGVLPPGELSYGTDKAAEKMKTVADSIVEDTGGQSRRARRHTRTLGPCFRVQAIGGLFQEAIRRGS